MYLKYNYLKNIFYQVFDEFGTILNVNALVTMSFSLDRFALTAFELPSKI